MVALAVFSMGALALLNVLGESSRSADIAADRALARIVAENRLVEVMAASRPPAMGAFSGTEEQLSRSWEWTVTVAPSPDPLIARIDVTVRAAGRAQTLADLTTFRAAS